MRRSAVPVFLLLIGTIGLTLANDLPNTTHLPAVNGKNSRVAQSRTTSESGPAKASHHDAVIKQVTDALLTAYIAGDATNFAGCFTVEGEYIDAKGTVFHGRKAIEDEFTAFFRETPDTTIEIASNTTRSIATGVIASDCTTAFKRTATSQAVPGRCQLVASHEGDKWLIASLRETETGSSKPSHHAQVSQLDWMIGEWIGEGPRSHVHFSCRWDEGGNYLLRDFTVQAAGANPLSGTQRIGYDPISGHLKMWVFDKAGGYSDGDFTRDGDTWVLRTSGVTSDGRIASTTNVYSKIDDHRISSELIERSTGGERIGHTEKITLVRKPRGTPDRSAQSHRQNN